MTQPTHDEVMAQLNEWISDLQGLIELDGARMNHSTLQEHKVALASLLANRAGLERHEMQELTISFTIAAGHRKAECCPSCVGAIINDSCPTYTEIYDLIRSVM